MGTGEHLCRGSAGRGCPQSMDTRGKHRKIPEALRWLPYSRASALCPPMPGPAGSHVPLPAPQPALLRPLVATAPSSKVCLISASGWLAHPGSQVLGISKKADLSLSESLPLRCSLHHPFLNFINHASSDPANHSSLLPRTLHFSTVVYSLHLASLLMLQKVNQEVRTSLLFCPSHGH